MPLYLVLFFWYALIATSLFGVVVVYFFDFSFYRLDGISRYVVENVFFHVIYSFVVVSSVMYFTARLLVKSHLHYYSIFLHESPSKYNKLSLFLVFLNLVYLLFVSFLYFDSIPLFSVFSADLDDTLALARSAHVDGAYSLPYISKFFDFSNIFSPILVLTLFLRGDKKYFSLVIAYSVSAIYLSMDLQKAPFLLLCLMSMCLLVVFSEKKSTLFFRLICFLALGALMLFFYSFFMGKDFFDMILYLLDRPIFGQVQGMYYIYEYYNPSTSAMFSSFYLSFGEVSTVLPPDQYIANYVYPGNENIVNVNTYFVGEAWGFGGDAGVYLSAWAVAFSISAYMFFWSFLFRVDTHVTYLMAMVFFTFLPINQSLQFIVYQKYFLYFALFFMLPIFLLMISFSGLRSNDK